MYGRLVLMSLQGTVRVNDMISRDTITNIGANSVYEHACGLFQSDGFAPTKEELRGKGTEHSELSGSSINKYLGDLVEEERLLEMKRYEPKTVYAPVVPISKNKRFTQIMWRFEDMCEFRSQSKIHTIFVCPLCNSNIKPLLGIKKLRRLLLCCKCRKLVVPTYNKIFKTT